MVKQGATNTQSPTTYEFSTDAKGNFSTTMGGGIWCVALASQSSEPPSVVTKNANGPRVATAETDLACLDKLWARCLAVLEVHGPMSDAAGDRQQGNAVGVPEPGRRAALPCLRHDHRAQWCLLQVPQLRRDHGLQLNLLHTRSDLRV